MRIGFLAVCAGVVFTGSVSALAAPGELEMTAAREAEARGGMMFAYDQAAWHATDRFQADLAKEPRGADALRQGDLKGYIVEPETEGRLLTTFYGEQNGQWIAIARYTVAASAVTSGGFVGPDGPRTLSLVAQKMIDAREEALTELDESRHGFCSESPPNTLVLPPDSRGMVRVYFLTSTNVAGIYPAGGHYRFDFDNNGKLVGERRFMNTCFPLDYRGKDGKRPEMIVLSHLLDPQPTEIHAFVSRNIPVPMAVVTTGNKHIWSVANGAIGYIQDVEGEGPSS